MLWGKKKRLLKELLFFYAVVNTNVIMVNYSPNNTETFKKIISVLDSYMSQIVLKLLSAKEIQKMVKKDTELKKIWSTVKIEKPTVEPVDDRADYFS